MRLPITEPTRTLVKSASLFKYEGITYSNVTFRSQTHIYQSGVSICCDDAYICITFLKMTLDFPHPPRDLDLELYRSISTSPRIRLIHCLILISCRLYNKKKILMKAKLANRRHICQVTIALPWRSEWVSSGQKLIRLFLRLYQSHEGIAPVSQGGRGTAKVEMDRDQWRFVPFKTVGAKGLILTTRGHVSDFIDNSK